jgi:phosphohistidine phosphatase
MQRLILLRHGKAESVAASGGDIERGLTERGRRDSALIGRILAEAGMTPDLTLVSAARRARETWDEAAPAFPGAHCEISRQLYLASSEQLTQVTQAIAEPITSLMIVGHNPGLHDFALSLLRQQAQPLPAESPLIASFPTGAAAVFCFEPSGEVRFERMFLPRKHAGGSH